MLCERYWYDSCVYPFDGKNQFWEEFVDFLQNDELFSGLCLEFWEIEL